MIDISFSRFPTRSDKIKSIVKDSAMLKPQSNIGPFINEGAISIPTYPEDPTIPNAEPTSFSGSSSTIMTYMLMDSEAEVKP